MSVIFGTDGRDVTGTEGSDTIYGYARGRAAFDTGNDVLNGGKGNDLLYGGNRNDILRGGEGDDTIYGGFGNDRLEGGKDQDALYGGSVLDVIFGGEGGDLIFGGSGEDTLDGGDDDDTIFGGSASDLIKGSAGNDTIYGDGTAANNGSADRLFGGEGTDTIFGGGGADWIDGGTGQDFLTGGGGTDRFVFRGQWDFDTVIDFQNGLDRLDLRTNGIVFSDLNFEMVDADSDGNTDDVLIKISGGAFGEIALLDTDMSVLGASDFIF